MWPFAARNCPKRPSQGGFSAAAADGHEEAGPPSPLESLSFRASLFIGRRWVRRSPRPFQGGLPCESARVGVLALERLYDQPLPDRPRRGLDPYRAAVDKSGDLLDIGLDCPACARRDLGAYPTEILGATAVTDPVASPGAGAGEMADAGHRREYRGGAGGCQQERIEGSGFRVQERTRAAFPNPEL